MSSPWYAPLPPGPPPRLTLVALPFAGGGVGIFRTWSAAAPPGVQVVPIWLPGRERRLRERPYVAMGALLDDLLPALAPLTDRPWAVFGHSMGAAVAHALAVRAAAAGREPAHLFVSARRAPSEPRRHPPLFALPDEALLTETQRHYGPLPEALQRHPGLVRAMLPTLRADYRLLETHTPSTDTALTCDVTAYAGADDTAHPPGSLAGWADVTTGALRTVTLPGGHFTGVRDASTVRDDVMATLARLTGGAPPDAAGR